MYSTGVVFSVVAEEQRVTGFGIEVLPTVRVAGLLKSCLFIQIDSSSGKGITSPGTGE
jgi:hypothetical protein